MIEASEADWKLFLDLLVEQFGLEFDVVRRGFLEARLAARFRELRLSSLAEYYRYLRFHPDRTTELVQLKLLVTNNETYFFRESHQFDAFARLVVPALEKKGLTRPIRVLSAGCSSGEEPYSISFSLQQAGLGLRGVGVEIDACDLNPARIAHAREGRYEESSFRGCEPHVRDLYFSTSSSGGGQVVKPQYRTGLRFFEANLVDPALPTGMSGSYDAIYCRNVLIYFSDAAFERALSLFARSLAPGGHLFLGHSESLIGRRRDFTPISLDGTIAYRKAGDP